MPEARSSYLPTLTLLAVLPLLACGGSDDQAAHTSEDPAGSRAGEAAVAQEPGDEASPATSTETSETDDRLGRALDHPERYYGVYANPAAANRDWFVTAAERPKYAEQAPEVPPGYLAVGAMFGDVAPWHMKTLSDTEFVQAWADHSPDPATVEFELGDDGNAVAMTFTNEQLASEGRLERKGDLPEDWE